MTTTSPAPLRRWIVRTTIGAFSLAALLGILALLQPGAFGETEGDILLTTLLVGVVSIAVLCYLATSGRPFQPVGVVGGVTVLVPLATALVLIWGRLEGAAADDVVRAFGVGAIVAATLAQACLLLVVGSGAVPAVRRVLLATIALAGLVALLTSLLVLGLDPGREWYYRVLGVVAILDVLGTVVGSALARFGPGAAAPAARRDVPGEAGLHLPPELAARVDAEARRTGTSPSAVVEAAVTAYLGSRPHAAG